MMRKEDRGLQEEFSNWGTRFLWEETIKRIDNGGEQPRAHSLDTGEETV